MFFNKSDFFVAIFTLVKKKLHVITNKHQINSKHIKIYKKYCFVQKNRLGCLPNLYQKKY